MDTLKDIT